MAQIDDVRKRAVLLTGDSTGVLTEQTPRKIQVNGDAYKTTLSPSWLHHLDLAEQSAEAMHSLSLGARPVIVQQPAIIVQPANLIRKIEAEENKNGRRGANPW